MKFMLVVAPRIETKRNQWILADWRGRFCWPTLLVQFDSIFCFDNNAKTRATDKPKTVKPTHRFGEVGPIPSTSVFKYRIAKRTADAMRNFNADAVRIDFIAG